MTHFNTLKHGLFKFSIISPLGLAPRLVSLFFERNSLFLGYNQEMFRPLPFQSFMPIVSFLFTTCLFVKELVSLLGARLFTMPHIENPFIFVMASDNGTNFLPISIQPKSEIPSQSGTLN